MSNREYSESAEFSSACHSLANALTQKANAKRDADLAPHIAERDAVLSVLSMIEPDEDKNTAAAVANAKQYVAKAFALATAGIRAEHSRAVSEANGKRVTPSHRQASKFLNKKGSAYAAMKAAKSV